MNNDANPYDHGHRAGRAVFRTGKTTVNPHKPGFDDWKMWDIGYSDGFSEAEAQDKGDDYEDEAHD
jgi:hypothetical protein